jgi:dynein heavy chain
LIAKVSPRKLTIELPDDPSILELLVAADKRLEKILKSMNAYLQTKREAFARFYFLSNEELLDALG